jgi:hypothetical protein
MEVDPERRTVTFDAKGDKTLLVSCTNSIPRRKLSTRLSPGWSVGCLSSSSWSF